MIAEQTSLKDAVNHTRNEHMAAVNAGNADAAASLFGPDAVLLPPGQPALSGAQIRGWFDYVFGNFQAEGFAIRPTSVEERGDVVIESGNWSATFHPKAAPTQSVEGNGTYLTVYTRLADGSVRVFRDIFNGMPGQ